YWTLVSSLAPDAQLFGGRSILPFPLTFEHYRALFAERDFWLPIRNSLIVASATTVLAVAIGSICAYALARLRFRGKAPLLAMGLAISMFPQISLVPPMYLALREVGLIDTFTGLVIPYLTFALPISIWLL